MFKSLFVYKVSSEFFSSATLEGIQEALEKCPFTPCGPSQDHAAGWVAPRGIPNAPLVESVEGKHWLCKLMFESKSVPREVLTRHVDEEADKIEQATGRKPGRKQRKDIEAEVRLTLLPHAFPKRSSAQIWLSPEMGLLMIDCGSSSRAEEIISLLVKQLEGFSCHLVQSAESPAACMAAWLMDGVAPENFTIDRECVLQAPDEIRSAVKYSRHSLDIDEIKAHLTAGKSPTKLALSYKDRISFTLTDTLQIRSIQFLDLVFEGKSPASKDEAFDADAALSTLELSALIPALIEGLGGHHEFLGSAPQADGQVEQGSEAESAEVAGQAPWDDEAEGVQAGEGPDTLLETATAIVRAQGRASISLLQLQLRIGYRRAHRLLEAMELAGIVGPMANDGSRAVIRPSSASQAPQAPAVAA